MATATRTYTCMGCGLTVTADTDYTGQLCETCELVALAIVDGDDEHREAFGAKFEEITRRAERACCSRCAKDLGWSVDAVLICWREFPMILCDGCSEAALALEEAQAHGLSVDDATFCDGCGTPMWLGLDVQRRSQDGADFYCETCTELRADGSA